MSEEPEPMIIVFGREHIEEYPVAEYKDSLSKAFKKNKADSITLDSNPRSQRFLAACAAWAIQENLLYHDHSFDEGQQIISFFKLTEKGKSEILGQSS